ncbi:MAG: insulinase family protein [Alcanivoracaceae bacterium]|nr:insulinase family protein [Alcanivoracaceae bacterium]
MRNVNKLILITSLLSLGACQTPQKTAQVIEKQSSEINFDLPFEQFTLENGLNVILHEDHSDPIVALATIAHVGSNREKAGRTGFAHFFEHMAFNNSENVPMGANRKMIPELGGSRNGGTWNDGTMYYEVVPKDAFEKLMWIDSDRFGYMINTVTEGTLEREKQVVKNEKRQRVDNRAYGHTGHVIRKNLYPTTHPYNWTVIGDLEDLQNATLADVREFYNKYYIPSNATLVIAGDIDPVATKKLVQNWFGEIKAGNPIEDLKPQSTRLTETKKLYHIDNFAKLPEIRLTYPTVEQFHQDAYALDALASVLSEGKKSPLFTTIVEENKQAPGVFAYQNSDELAGTFTVRIRANAGVDLDDVKESIQQAMLKFEKQGIRPNDLIKIKASQETEFYNGISSILNKAFQLGIYSEFAGDPAFIKQDIKNILAVTEEDIIRVYNKYIKDKSAIITSFVPKGELELTVENSIKANVIEEKIEQGIEKEIKEDLNPVFTITPSSFDRSEPPLTALPVYQAPHIWHESTAQGMQIIGVHHSEVPLVNFSLQIEGGQQMDAKDKLGTANLLAEMMNEGTKFKTPSELEDAIGLLGSSLTVSGSQTSIVVSGQSLAKNFKATIDLLTEIILYPRFAEDDFNRLKTRQLTSIKDNSTNPNRVASNVLMRQLYGQDHVFGQVLGGSLKTVENIQFEDIENWYHKNLSLNLTSFRVVGDIKSNQVLAALMRLDKNLKNTQVTVPSIPEVEISQSPRIFFVDFPDAKQSALYVGKPTVSAIHADINRLDIVNNRLGNGSSARLTQTLRIQKGYTYGAYSGVRTGMYQSLFFAATQVRSNVTLESLQILRDLISHYSVTFMSEDLEVTKNLITKGNTRKFETLDQIMRMVNNISNYNLTDNYLDKNQQELNDMTLKGARAIIDKYLNEQQMIYVIVGDAKTQLDRVLQFGYGAPILLDYEGNEIN